jgi:hypothetical protein
MRFRDGMVKYVLRTASIERNVWQRAVCMRFRDGQIRFANGKHERGVWQSGAV